MAEHHRLQAAALQQVPGLELERPIVFFDLETTGFNAREDRIVELACLKVHPNRQVDVFGGGAARVKPGIPIPAEATRVHKISNTDVQHCPCFDGLAPALLDFLGGCDLCGYNIRQLDVCMLKEEFRRCGVNRFPAPGTRLLDVCLLFPDRRPLKLTSAVGYYLGRQHTAAHSSFGDVLATMGLLKRMLEQHGNVLPRTVAALDDWGCRFHATPCGRLRWRACSSVHVPGITIEELYIYDYKFLQCDGTNYHDKRVWDVASTPGFRRAVAQQRHFYQPEALEILDRAAAGDDSVCWRMDGVVKADIFEA